jgi:hypothetical protein
MNVPQDFKVLNHNDDNDFDYIHYTIEDNDVYFVSNQTLKRQKIICQFRISGKMPELWDANTGQIRVAEAFVQKDNLTSVPLTLEPYGTIIVLFHKNINRNKDGRSSGNYPDFETLKTITGDWTVSFDPK